MQEKKDEHGRRYIELTPEETEEARKAGKTIYGSNMLAPDNCKHEFEVSRGIPSNIKGCKYCIYWEFTDEEPTTGQ